MRWNAGRFHPKNWSQRSFWPSRAGLLLCLLPLQHTQHSCHCQGHWPSCHFFSHFLHRRVKGAAIPSTQLLCNMLWYQLLRIEWWDLQEVKHLVKAWACKSSSLSQALWPYAEFLYHTHSYSILRSEMNPPAISTKNACNDGTLQNPAPLPLASIEPHALQTFWLQ